MFLEVTSAESDVGNVSWARKQTNCMGHDRVQNYECQTSKS